MNIPIAQLLTLHPMMFTGAFAVPNSATIVDSGGRRVCILDGMRTGCWASFRQRLDRQTTMMESMTNLTTKIQVKILTKNPRNNLRKNQMRKILMMESLMATPTMMPPIVLTLAAAMKVTQLMTLLMMTNLRTQKTTANTNTGDMS